MGWQQVQENDRMGSSIVSTKEAAGQNTWRITIEATKRQNLFSPQIHTDDDEKALFFLDKLIQY